MERIRIKSKKHFRWVRLLGICVILFFSLKIGQQYQRCQVILREVEIYRQKLVEAQEEYEYQQERLKLYYSDSFLEQIARSSLGMVKVGEIVISPAEVSDVLEYNDTIREKDVIH